MFLFAQIETWATGYLEGEDAGYSVGGFWPAGLPFLTNQSFSISIPAGTIQIGLLPLAQTLRPISDIATGGWLPSSGGDLYAMLNEAPPPNATTNIYSPLNPTTQQFEVLLDASSDPGTTDGHEVAIGLVAENLDTAFDFNLVEGTTVLDSWTESVTAAEGHVTRERFFASAVIAQITNRADVRIRGVARAP